MEVLLPQQRKVKPEQLVRLFQANQIAISIEEAEVMLDLLYTLALIFCQQNEATA